MALYKYLYYYYYYSDNDGDRYVIFQGFSDFQYFQETHLSGCTASVTDTDNGKKTCFDTLNIF